jgi:hypothetical protein
MKTPHLLILVLTFPLFFPSGLNAQDTIGYETRPFQFTFLIPPFSTNGYENARIVNSVSLNLFTGISGGVDGAEFGGFINVDRYFVRGFQAAGFGNVVGGDVEGLQLSGFFNANGGHTRYAQLAGFVNVTGHSQHGLQGAGFINVVGYTMDGFQGAGFMNATGGAVTGFQGAGFINVAGQFSSGLQAAGFGNVTGSGTVNLQASGFFNVADTVNGLQAAGFLNRAGTVNGVMAAGFINICDSINGVPIGFINIVRKNGYRSAEIAASETQYLQVSFRMGVEKLYTIYSIGKPLGPADRWMYGIGLGTQIEISEKFFMNVEGAVNHEVYLGPYSPGNLFFYHDALNMHNQLRVSIGRSLGNAAEAFVGPTFNVGIVSVDPEAEINRIAPGWALSYLSDTDRYETSYWVGLRGGVRF